MKVEVLDTERAEIINEEIDLAFGKYMAEEGDTKAMKGQKTKTKREKQPRQKSGRKGT